MSESKSSLTVKDIVEAAAARPNGFLVIDMAAQRSTQKSANRYADVFCVKKDGQKVKLAFSWKMEPLRGSLAPLKDRKFESTIQFRASSGDLGAAIVAIYKEFKRLIEEGIKNKLIAAKGGKALIRSIVQSELENGDPLDNPIIRLKLKFKDGKPCFHIKRIVLDEKGDPKTMDIKCTEQDIDTYIKSRMMSSGHVDLGTMCLSGFGISLPANVKLLVLKPVAPDAPDVSSLMSREEMLEMVGDMGDAAESKEDNESNETKENEDNDSDADNKADATEKQLEQLRQMALAEE